MKRLYTFFNNNNNIINLQFGFRQQYSTSRAMINVTGNTRKALDEANVGCRVFVDLQKKFDIVDHQILLRSWVTMRFVEFPMIALKSYLSNWNQYASINGYASVLVAVDCGDTQGSVLGPLLLLLYVRDIKQVIKFCNIHHFANDTNLLYLSSSSIKKLNKLVNVDLKHLVHWLKANKISLNVKQPWNL